MKDIILTILLIAIAVTGGLYCKKRQPSYEQYFNVKKEFYNEKKLADLHRDSTDLYIKYAKACGMLQQINKGKAYIDTAEYHLEVANYHANKCDSLHKLLNLR